MINIYNNAPSESLLNTYTVHTLWLKKELEDRGFKVISTKKSSYNKNLFIFYFEDTSELRETINHILRYEMNGSLPKPTDSKNR